MMNKICNSLIIKKEYTENEVTLNVVERIRNTYCGLLAYRDGFIDSYEKNVHSSMVADHKKRLEFAHNWGDRYKKVYDFYQELSEFEDHTFLNIKDNHFAYQVAISEDAYMRSARKLEEYDDYIEKSTKGYESFNDEEEGFLGLHYIFAEEEKDYMRDSFNLFNADIIDKFFENTPEITACGVITDEKLAFDSILRREILEEKLVKLIDLIKLIKPSFDSEQYDELLNCISRLAVLVTVEESNSYGHDELMNTIEACISYPEEAMNHWLKTNPPLSDDKHLCAKCDKYYQKDAMETEDTCISCFEEEARA